LEKYKAAAIQYEWKADKESNLSKAEELLEEAGKEGAKLAALQEYFLTIYGRKELAEPIPGPTTDRLGEIAKRFKMYIAAGTMVEKTSDGKIYSTLPLIDPNGKIIKKYRKVHMAGEVGFTRGTELPVVKTEDIGNIGLLAAVDLDAPLATWVIARKGCDVLVAPHICESKWVDAHRYLLRAAAWQNMIYIVAPNPVGYRARRAYFLGGSSIISPMGELLANAGEFSDGIAIATIDLVNLHKLREAMKNWKGQLVPEAYKPFIELKIQ